MKSMRDFSLALTAATIVALVAACSSGSPKTTALPSGNPPSVSAQQTSVAVAPPAGQTIEACSMLSDSEIQAITGRAPAKKTPGATMGIFDNGCEWELPEGPNDGVPWTVDLGVVSPGGRNYYDRFMAISGDPLTGFGDAAVSDEVGGITAVKGDTMVSVFVIAVFTDEQPMTRELTQTALSHVP